MEEQRADNEAGKVGDAGVEDAVAVASVEEAKERAKGEREPDPTSFNSTDAVPFDNQTITGMDACPVAQLTGGSSSR